MLRLRMRRVLLGVWSSTASWELIVLTDVDFAESTLALFVLVDVASTGVLFETLAALTEGVSRTVLSLSPLRFWLVFLQLTGLTSQPLLLAAAFVPSRKTEAGMASEDCPFNSKTTVELSLLTSALHFVSDFSVTPFVSTLALSFAFLSLIFVCTLFFFVPGSSKLAASRPLLNTLFDRVRDPTDLHAR
jgi:hypothetical protein